MFDLVADLKSNTNFIDLEPILFNPKCAKIIENNLPTLKKMISKYPLKVLANLLINFNQPDSTISREIADLLVESLAREISYFESIDIHDIFKKAL